MVVISPRMLLRAGTLPLFGAALAVTAVSQLPGHSFDRLRRRDLFGLVPNWKFFAPIPATDDHEVFHRTRTDDGEWGQWQRTSPPAPRKLAHLVWFPGRRADKGVFDHATELAQLAVLADPAELALSSSYLVVAATVRRTVATADGPRPHQFAIIKHAGSDDSVTPEVILLSPVIDPPTPAPVPPIDAVAVEATPVVSSAHPL